LRNLTLGGSWNGKSNIGIFKDALGDNPQLVAATRQIPYATASDLAVSSDGGFLFAAYPGIESTLAYDVGEIIETINSPDAQVRKRLEKEAIDEVNPDVSLAADLEIVSSNPWTREIEWRVPEGSQNGPISTGSLPWGVMMASNQELINLPDVDGGDLTPTLKWNVLKPRGKNSQSPPGEGGDCVSCGGTEEDEENLEYVRLYLSVFPEGQGLLPKDQWDAVKDKEKEDFNPNRILTAEWRDGQWKWLRDGTVIPNVEGEPPNTFEQFTVPEDRMLTGGQTYHWAVEVKWKDGAELKPGGNEEQIEIKRFETKLPTEEVNIPKDERKRFSSVTLLTPGTRTEEAIDFDFASETVDSIAAQLEDAGAAVMRYRPQSQEWSSVTYNDRYNWWDASNKSPEKGKPLVLVADWRTGLTQESFWNAGLAEAAADNLFASLTKLDLDYGGTVGEGNRSYDDKGNLIRKQGAVFNAPLHFIGFGQGAVVNTEIIQRLGTYFPEAGGFKDSEERDLHMTTVDPFEFNPETVPQFENNLARMLDPEIVVWENVTYADNYYQVQGKDDNIYVLKGKALAQADLNKELEDWAGFDRTKAEDDASYAAKAWYAGTANLNESQIPVGQQKVFRRLGDLLAENLNDSQKSWYFPEHTNAKSSNFTHGDPKAPTEGIGTGWLYSVNGGGDEFRPYFVEGEPKPKSKDELGDFKDYLEENRTPVTYDNTYSKGIVKKRLRGDYVVPTLFNGNFDVVAPGDVNADAPIPGWTFDGGGDANANSLQKNLIELGNLGGSALNRYRNGIGYDRTQPNYVLKLDTSLKQITHNPFTIPEWGNLRFDVYAPNRSGRLKVQLEVEGVDIPVKEINLEADARAARPGERGSVGAIKNLYNNNTNSIGYGRENGFETFQMNLQKLPVYDWKKLRGKPAKLTFTLEGDSEVFIDNVFFKSAHVKLGNPTNARWDRTRSTPTNLLIEKPGYTASYNTKTKIPNWVSWQVNQSWSEPFVRRQGVQFIDDPFLFGNSNWPKVDGTVFVFDELGMDKGHLIPDRDRNRNAKDAIETYMSTNLIAQSIDNNRVFDPEATPQIASAWYKIEESIQDGVEGNWGDPRGQEFYIVAGSLGKNWDIQKKSNAPEFADEDWNEKKDTNPQKLVSNKIHIPEWTWKTAIALRPGTEITSQTEAFAYITPNGPEPEAWPVQHPLNQLLGENRPAIQNRAEWRLPKTWQTSMGQIEELLNNREEPEDPDIPFNNEEPDEPQPPFFNFKFDFLSHLPDAVQNELKEKGKYSR
jgi:DNA/RNA endonuclease G (NUC1)